MSLHANVSHFDLCIDVFHFRELIYANRKRVDSHNRRVIFGRLFFKVRLERGSTAYSQWEGGIKRRFIDDHRVNPGHNARDAARLY